MVLYRPVLINCMYRKEQQRREEEMADEMQQQHFFIQVGRLPVMATALSQVHI